MAFLLFSKKYFRAGADTDCGLKRTENQDAYRCLPARGLFIVSDRLSYTIGIALGTVVAVGMSISMAKGLEKCLHMTRARGQWGMTVRSILRWLIMLAAVAAGLKFDRISFPGVILGIIGLKLAALLHVYTNTYITKRLKGEGR